MRPARKRLAVLCLVPFVALGLVLLAGTNAQAQGQAAPSGTGFQELPLVKLDPGADPALDRARSLLMQAASQAGQKRLPALQEILGLGIRGSEKGRSTLLETYLLMAEAYEGSPAKQIACWTEATALVRDAGLRDQLASHIERAADLPGANIPIVMSASGPAPLDPGPDDTCDGAVPIPVGPGSPHSEIMTISPAGDHNWRSFEVTGDEAWAVRIETLSGDIFGDDTTLALTDGCPGNLIDFDDDGGPGFLSLIETDCALVPGTYYIDVGGFADVSTPDDFEFRVEVTDTCIPPAPDAYEPDDERADAGRIGLPAAKADQGPGWGRANAEIQDRSIFPVGDKDHIVFDLSRNVLVQMKTAEQLPTFWNEGSSPSNNPDTVLRLFYPDEKDYGGRCNEPDIGFINTCFSDQDCFDVCGGAFPCNGPPEPGFPPCIPICNFNVPFACEGDPIEGNDLNPLAFNDDVGFPDFGSELTLCMPRTQPQSPSASAEDDWLVQIAPFSLLNTFNYQLGVKNVASCIFEQEPNTSLLTPTPLTLGDTVHGIFDFSETIPFQDSDFWSFDVTEDRLVTLETDGYNTLSVDTALQLIVGPNDDGDFFLVLEDDDGGPGYLSKIVVILPPASVLLGNTTADADYLLNVTSFYLNPNFPYTLHTASTDPPKTESEPNDDCATNAEAAALGDYWNASINPTCDFNTYKFTLTADTLVSIHSPSGGDSAIELRDCSDDSRVACDDDSGPGLLPLLEGCLPAGEYCAKVRAFSSFATFAYDLELRDLGSCVAGTDPPVTGDELFTCADFDNCP
jgi:hypothetical protein